MHHPRDGNAIMLPQPYLAPMDDAAILESLAAHDAVESLIYFGWPVQPHGPDMDRWQIGCLILTDEELMGLAFRQGLCSAVEGLQ